jgi:hypothetical protein
MSHLFLEALEFQAHIVNRGISAAQSRPELACERLSRVDDSGRIDH